MDTLAPGCFIVGPIGDRYADSDSEAYATYERALILLNDVFLPVCRTVGLSAVRADQIAATGEIPRQVVEHLVRDRLVIADLTDANPNVMYEVGIRHALNLPVVHVAEYGSLPFDIAHVRTIFFRPNERGFIDLRKQLGLAVSAALVDGSGPLQGLVQRAVLQIEAPRDAKLILGDQLGLDDGLTADGVLEYVDHMEEGFPKVTHLLDDIASEIIQLAAVTEVAGVQMTEETVNVTAKRRLQLLGQYADELRPIADRLDQDTRTYSAEMRDLDSAVTGLLRLILRRGDILPLDRRLELSQTVLILASASRQAMQGISGFGRAAEGLPALSKVLRGPGRKISESVQRLTDSASIIETWATLAGQVEELPLPTSVKLDAGEQ